MAEEIQNAAIVIPRSIMTGICINGSLGFGMLLAILFRAGDLDVALEENPAFPFMAIFYHAVNSRAGAAVMSSIIMVLTVSANVGFAASCSRVCWAFARDKGVPGWRTLSKVSDRTSLPVNAVAATSTIACILALVNIGSTTAFNGVISVSIAGLMSSYLLIATLLLYRRLTGSLLTSNQLIEYESGSGAPNDGKLRVLWGPWRMPGIFGIINNIFACIYLTFVFFFSFWPSFADVTPMNMNWAILVTGFVAICSGVYYMVWARHTYKGPVVEVSVRYIQGGPSIDEEEHKDW
jgi:choline transport protein